MPVPYLACMALVASIYHLPPRVLSSIQAIEGGWPGAVIRNTNGSEDLGVMQVNTLWIGPLVRYTGLPAPVVRQKLITLPCFNIAAAGAILRDYLDEANGDLMQAIGYYHSHWPALGLPYQVRVRNAAATLFARSGTAAIPPTAR
jgi:soluble lytic murein transglycosylase-like protein